MLHPADLACFQSLKAEWKREMRNFQTEDLTKCLTKSGFANVFMKQLASETVMKCFLRSGLDSDNPKAVDYSKCFGKNSSSEIVEDQRLSIEQQQKPQENIKEMPIKEMTSKLKRAFEIIAQKLGTGSQPTDQSSAPKTRVHTLGSISSPTASTPSITLSVPETPKRKAK